MDSRSPMRARNTSGNAVKAMGNEGGESSSVAHLEGNEVDKSDCEKDV